MRKLLAIGVAGAALWGMGCASAADLGSRPVYKAPPPVAAPVPVFSWTGFYIGGHFGYLWGDVDVEHAEALPAATGTGGRTNGVVGGILGGGNWQIGPVVLGAEADFGWSDAHGKGVAAQFSSAEDFAYKIDSTGHARGRIGYAFGGTLVYVAGGLAVARAHVQETEPVLSSAPGGTYTGGSIGGGVEQAFTRQISGRIEYLYDDFGHKTYTIGDDGYRVHVTGQTLRGAVVFRFGP
jgi:outer membrane immunogenic protein